MKQYRKKSDIPDKSELKDLYEREGTTISSLSRQYNVTTPTMRFWLNSYNIVLKDHKQASAEANNRKRRKAKPTKEILETLYKDSNIDSLEKYFGVGQQTIYEWLREFNIQIRTLSESSKKAKRKQHEDVQFSREFLDQEYDRTKSIEVLSDKLNVSRSHIRQQLLKNGIKIEPIEPSWRSKAEIELYTYLVSQFPDDEWQSNTKTLIPPYELDIINHTKKLAIEYCGIYWHSEMSSGKKQNYHREKYLRCKETGYTLITIFESDDKDKVKSLLMKLLGKTTKIGARKTKVMAIPPKEAKQFHDKHHLHSGIGAKYHYGLFYENNLVMVASFIKNRYSTDYEYECARITSHSDYTTVGGVSKLIKHFIKTENPESIITFADLRFGEGNVYLNCGFTRLKDSFPNYWYSKKYTPILYSRVKFQKHKLKTALETFDPLLTEYENMLENNWDRIWDCGNGKYVWVK